MNFHEFCKNLIDRVSEKLPWNFIIETIQVNTKQGSTLGLMIGKADSTVLPVLSLYGYYRRYLNEGISLEDLSEEVIKETAIALRNAPTINTEEFSSWDKMKSNLILNLVPAKQSNGERLEKLPHRLIGDMALTCHIRYPNSNGSAQVTGEILKDWGITEKELFEAAFRYSPENVPVSIRTMSEVLKEMEEKTGAYMPCAEEDPPMWVVSNKTGCFGSSALFYPGVMDRIARIIGGSYFVLPSSIHEVLIVNAEGSDPEYLASLVKNINRTEVSAAEVLSDKVYFYDPETHNFRACPGKED